MPKAKKISRRVGHARHEDVLGETLKGLRRDGWRVVDLQGKSPDAIAALDGRIVAIEVLASGRKTTERLKRQQYSMFDEVLVYFYDASNGAGKKPKARAIGDPLDAVCDVCNAPLVVGAQGMPRHRMPMTKDENRRHYEDTFVVDHEEAGR